MIMDQEHLTCTGVDQGGELHEEDDVTKTDKRWGNRLNWMKKWGNRVGRRSADGWSKRWGSRVCLQAHCGSLASNLSRGLVFLEKVTSGGPLTNEKRERQNPGHVLSTIRP